jgi:hypothetical protein
MTVNMVVPTCGNLDCSCGDETAGAIGMAALGIDEQAKAAFYTLLREFAWH